MAIQTKNFMEWVGENTSKFNNAIKSNLMEVSKGDMVRVMNENLRPLQDGVFIGKQQRESWGNYFRAEPWQTTSIGITAADADAIVVAMAGYRLGIALTEPVAMSWGSSTGSSSVLSYKATSDLNTFDGKDLTAGVMRSSYNKDDDPASNAVAYCYNYSKGHSGDAGGDTEIAAHSWWLPSMGELALIHQHFETINLALQRIKNAGKQDVSLLQRTTYWSSCEYSGTGARYLSFSTGYRGDNTRASTRHVRAVTAF